MSARLAVRGALAALSPRERTLLLDRGPERDDEIRRVTAGILGRVRREGDAALRAMAREFDGVELAELEVPRARWKAAKDSLAPDLVAGLERAAENIRLVHQAFRPVPSTVTTPDGVLIGRRPDPLARVGVYAPGGRAAYPSSLLMGAVPARVAGVKEVIVCSPPGRDGLPPPVVLAAAAIAGADRLFAVGGAGAIGALAYGTGSIPAVDRVVGPGNAWVTEAKLQVMGAVGIDAPAGPSELLVLADECADPGTIVREMLAQAEHDPRAAVVLVTTSAAVAELVESRLVRSIARAARASIIAAAASERGAILLAASLEEGLAFAAEYAPEHLLVLTRNPGETAARARSAGMVFVGATSSVVFGDYLTGANHVLPTGGAARRWSGLSTQDFVRWTTWQEVTPAAAERLAADTVTLALAEGLPAHAAAVAPVADLCDNINLWGPPPRAASAFAALGPARLASYPGPDGGALRPALARYLGVPEDAVVLGCGSDDLLDAAFRLCPPGSSAAWPEPTFSLIPVFARTSRLVPRTVRLSADGCFDVETVLASAPGLVYLCSPNNPTGTALAAELVREVLDRAPGLVVIDEAYVEFAGGTAWLGEALRRENVLVTRTFSKAWGLAGLRVGYVVGSPALMASLRAQRGPYGVNAAAEAVARAALLDVEWMRTRAAEVVANRTRMARALEALGFGPLPSAANFLCVPVACAAALAAALLERGVAVRAFSALPGIGDAIRIGVGPWSLMQRCLDALAEIR